MKKNRRRPVKDADKAIAGASRNSAKGALCPYCGKRTYFTRKYAREAGKRLYPGDKMSPYECRKAPDWVDTAKMWHLGHLHELIKEKGLSRTEFYGGQALRAPERATVVTNDKDEGEPMPTVGEVAIIDLLGFDRHSKRYRDVTVHSPIEERVALVHAALRAYALTHSFEEGEWGGHHGYVGRVSFKQVVRDLFGDELRDGDDEELHPVFKAIYTASDRAGLTHCLDSSQRHEGVKPIWWIASSFEDVVGAKPLAEEPKAPKKQANPKPALDVADDKVAEDKPARKVGRNGGRVKGSRNRTRLELLSLLERTVKAAGRPVLLDEAYAMADFPVTKQSLRDVAKELVKERRLAVRPATQDDRDAMKAGGATTEQLRGAMGQARVYMHAKLVPEDGVIPTITWEAEPAAEGEPIPATREAADDDGLAAAEARAKVERAMAAGVEGAQEAGRQIAREVKARVAERQANQPMEMLQEMLVTKDGRIRDLEAENARLKKRIAGLIAVVQTMEE